MSDDELNEIDLTLTPRIMARQPEKYIASPERDPRVSPWRVVSYDPAKDRDPCPWCGKRHQ
jgi:hypothetical protein